MTIDEADLQEFQRLYEEAYGEKLTEGEAQGVAVSLVYLYEHLVYCGRGVNRPADAITLP